MIKNILALVILVSLTGCPSFRSHITVEEVYPPIEDDNPILIYFNIQELPDSAVYIGRISTNFNPMGMTGMSQRSMVNSVGEDVKEKGGNAIKLDKEKDEDSRFQVLKGEVWRLKPFERIPINTDSLKSDWKENGMSEFEGIYNESLEGFGEKYKFDYISYACIERNDGNYVLVYLGGYDVLNKLLLGMWDMPRIWRTGDIYAYLNKTENSNIFRTTYYTSNKAPIDKGLFKFESGNLRCYYPNGMDILRKVYPDTSIYEDFIGTMTGFAVTNNRILSCYHGLDEKDAKIFIKGVNNDFTKKYEAEIENFDKVKDIAVIKLKDESVSLGDIPFAQNIAEKSTGDAVYVLGYPMSLIMGEEIKLTDGLISSRSGYAGDITTYQISAPVQSGNSGAPVLDKNGSLVGMVNSGIKTADNVGYAVKIKLINDFMTENGYPSLKEASADNEKPQLSSIIESVKNSIYIIELIDTEEKKISPRAKRQTRERNPRIK